MTSLIGWVPEVHVADAGGGRGARGGPERPDPPLIRIGGSGAVGGRLPTVPYRGHWFSIDDRDIRSKRLFSF